MGQHKRIVKRERGWGLTFVIICLQIQGKPFKTTYNVVVVRGSSRQYDFTVLKLTKIWTLMVFDRLCTNPHANLCHQKVALFLQDSLAGP